ncbi:universal stress protein [Roseovarius aquimarinus]|uniref:Universal stress protein n=1 Tax=Roseovarius aquimarinus TaxID=1229156 RepID=A0ABW7I7W4_9RHOB
MYKTILVPVVFDEDKDHAKVLKLATSLGASDAKITLLHVMEQLPAYATSYVPEQASANLRVELQKEMDKLTRDLPGVDGKIVDGHSGRTIVNHAKKNDVDLIIVNSHQPGFGDFILGSTAAYVVRHATCAVHVVK